MLLFTGALKSIICMSNAMINSDLASLNMLKDLRAVAAFHLMPEQKGL